MSVLYFLYNLTFKFLMSQMNPVFFQNNFFEKYNDVMVHRLFIKIEKGFKWQEN